MGDDRLGRPPAEEPGEHGVGRGQEQAQDDEQGQGDPDPPQDGGRAAVLQRCGDISRGGQAVPEGVEGPYDEVGERQVEQASATCERRPEHQQPAHGQDVEG